MKDYRKMSRSQLLRWIERMKSSQATRARAQRQRTASAISDREAKLHAILDTAVEGIITIDGHGVIESFNRAAEKIFGYKAREIIGRNVSALMPSPHRGHHDGYIRNYLKTGRAKIIGIGREVSGQRKDGTIFPMDLAVSEVKQARRRLFTGFIRDITERKRLEQEILEISNRERHRIGYDLHDGLCQQLAGIELMSQVVEQKLARRDKSAAAQVGEIARNIREAIGQTRSLARGLSPVALEAEGLMHAFQELAENTSKLFRVNCRFEAVSAVLVHDQAVASNLFRIAQEAVSNAIKHGKARHITIQLAAIGGRIVLNVTDDGCGFSKKSGNSKGMGLRIMQSRTGMIGGTLAVHRTAAGGVIVICSAPKPVLAKRKENRGR